MKGIVVIDSKKGYKSDIIRFKNSIHLKKFSQVAKQRGYKVYIINCLNPTPPPNKKQSVRKKGKTRKGRSKRRHIYWCPYCVHFRKFKKSLDYRRCEICGISNEEYYVRVYNKLGGKK